MELEEFMGLYHPSKFDSSSEVLERLSILYQGLSESGLAQSLNEKQARVILGACERSRDVGYGRGLSRGAVGMMPAR